MVFHVKHGIAHHLDALRSIALGQKGWGVLYRKGRGRLRALKARRGYHLCGRETQPSSLTFFPYPREASHPNDALSL